MTICVGVRRYAAILAVITLFATLSACGDKAPDIPSDPSPVNVHRLVTGPDGDQFLSRLSRHPWGSESQNAAGLFTWIAPDAASADPETRKLAAETAYAIATFLSDNAGALTGSTGEGKEDESTAIGAVNPDLTQAYADALIPYLGAMVGDDKAISGFQPLDPLEGRMPRTSAMLGVLNINSAAGNRLADAVTALAGRYEEDLAESAAADPTLVASNDPSLLRAARLLGLAKSSNLESSTGSRFEPGDVVTDFQYRLAAKTIRGPNIDLPQQYFNQDGSLMSPDEVRDEFGESGWDDYSSKLGAYLAKSPANTRAVDAFRNTFSAAADSRPN
jgi:hypothetical protein